MLEWVLFIWVIGSDPSQDNMQTIRFNTEAACKTALSMIQIKDELKDCIYDPSTMSAGVDSLTSTVKESTNEIRKKIAEQIAGE